MIIPGFGGFVSNYYSAKVIHNQGKIIPPAKSIAFNKNLISNDGLLVNYISRQEKLSLPEAAERVKQFAEQCKEALYNKEIILLPGIGKIFLDIENNIQFLQDKSLNHLINSYGLPDAVAYAIKRNKIVDTKLALSEEVIPIKRNNKRIFWYAAAGFFLLLSALGSYYFIENENARLQACNLFLGAFEKEQPKELPPPVTDAAAFEANILNLRYDFLTYESSPEEIASEEVPAEPAPAVNPAPVRTPEPNTILNNTALPKGYYVVIGSFTRGKNADKLFEKLKENNQVSYQIPGDQGFTRIGIFISSNLEEATKKLDSLRRVYNDSSWILKNN